MAQILIGTEIEQFEEEFKRAIRSTWEAIASDVVDGDDFEYDLASVVEVTLDANRVEYYGYLTGEAEIAWKKWYNMGGTYELRRALAKEALQGYVY
jgi:hypothetical protein